MIIIMTFTAIFKSNDFSSECECLAKSNRTRNCIVFVVVESNSALWNARGIYTKILNVTLIGFIFQFDSCSTQTNTQSQRNTHRETKPGVSLYTTLEQKIPKQTQTLVRVKYMLVTICVGEKKRIMLCICIKNNKNVTQHQQNSGLKESDTKTTTQAFKTKQCKAMLEKKWKNEQKTTKNKIELYRVYNKI